MRKPAFSHAAWFAAGAILGGAVAGFWPSRPGPGASAAVTPSVAAPLRKPNVSNPAESAAKPDPESALNRALTSPPGLRRSRDFLTFLEGVNAGNWQAEWERFSAASKGKGTVHDADMQLLLCRIGEVAGETGTAWFLKAGKKDQAGQVLTAWASLDPRTARAWLEAAPQAGDLIPALIRGIGLHSMESLLEFAGSGEPWAYNNYSKELIEAARLKGTPAQGEQMWRNYLEITERGQSVRTKKRLREEGASFVMLRSLTAWQVEAALAAGVPTAARDWLSSIVTEGYRVNEDNLSSVGHAAWQTDPEGTLLWAADMASIYAEGDPVQLQRITRQQGFEAAKQWAKKDAMALSQWLTANPAHPAYDTGAAALYLALKDSDPSAAAAWGAAVKDGSLRQWTKLDAPPPAQ